MAKAILTTKVDPTYDDLPEERYHFPSTYLRQVEAAKGDFVIYYEPRRSSGNLSSRGGRQAYFATARIVDVVPDPTRSDHFYARIDPTSISRERFPSARASTTTNPPSSAMTARRTRARSARASPVACRKRIRSDPEGRLRERSRRPVAPSSVAPTPFGGFAEPPAAFERPIVERVVARPFREAAFSGSIKAAYDDTCAFTGLKIINGGDRSEVQAAHIRPVAASGPDSLRNGIALSGTVHWMFDRGLISIADDHELLFAKGKVPEQVMQDPQFRSKAAPASASGSSPTPHVPAVASRECFRGIRRS